MILNWPDSYADVSQLKTGQLIAWEVERIGLHAVCRALRVIGVRPVPEAERTAEDRSQRFPPHYLDVRDAITGDHLSARVPASQRRMLLLDEHYPRCSRCGQMWPCRDQLIEIEARQNADRLNTRCVVCGDSYGARMAEVRTETPDGVALQRYHTRKGSSCRTAYLKAIANDQIALAALRREDAHWAPQRKGAA